MNEKSGHMSELDSLLDELHNATAGGGGATTNGPSHLQSGCMNVNANSAAYARTGAVDSDNYSRTPQSVITAPSPGIGQYKPPLDSLINDLESSIKLNEARPNMRSSYMIDRNSTQIPSVTSKATDNSGPVFLNNNRSPNSVNLAPKLRQQPVHETNLDEIMSTVSQDGLSPKHMQEISTLGSTDGYYDVPTLEDDGGIGDSRMGEGIYDNTNYADPQSVTSSEHQYTSMEGNNFPINQQSRTSHDSRSSFEESNRASTGSKIEPTPSPEQPNSQQRQSVQDSNRGSTHTNGTLTNNNVSGNDSNFQQCFENVASKMANLGIHGPSKGVCEKCGMTIHGQIVTAVGKLWHPLCFTCVVCVRELAGEDFFERHGEAFCQSCYQQSFAPKCAHCNSAILDTFVSALDQNWHPECFVCARCSLRLGEGDVSYHEGVDGKAYCSSCYARHCAPKCRGKRCGGEAIFQQYVSALGGHWHPECFICFDCGKEFSASGNFFEFEGDPFCEIHYHQRRGSLCMRCSQPITGRCITAMGGKRFHPEHFVCVFCLRQLNKGTFREHKSQPYCHPCFVRLFGH